MKANTQKPSNRFLALQECSDDCSAAEDTPLQSRLQIEKEDFPPLCTKDQAEVRRKRKEKSDDSDPDAWNKREAKEPPTKVAKGIQESDDPTSSEDEEDIAYQEQVSKRVANPSGFEKLIYKVEDILYYMSFADEDGTIVSYDRVERRLEKSRVEANRLKEIERQHKEYKEENEKLKEEISNLKLQIQKGNRKVQQATKSTNTEKPKISNKSTNTKKATGTEIGTNTETSMIAEQEEKTNEPNKLEERIERIEHAILKLVEREQTAPPATVSYAQITKKSIKPRNHKDKHERITNKPHRHVATIYHKDNNTESTSEKTRDALLKSITNKSDQSKIKNIRRIQKGGILVETATREDLDKLLQNEKLNEAGFQTGVPAKKKPKVVFYNTPKEMTAEQLIGAIRKNNVIKNDDIKEIKPLFKTAKGNHWVVETTPKIRDNLISIGRLFIEWSSCPVRDYIVASRCFRCQAFGHIAKHCLAAADVCGHCAEEGHTFKVCPNKEKEPSCCNCKRNNKPHEHSSRGDECPAYKAAKENIVRKTDYGE